MLNSSESNESVIENINETEEEIIEPLPEISDNIDESQGSWHFEIIEDEKQEVNISVVEVKKNIIEIVLDNHPTSSTKNSYKWNMALCNEQGTNLKYGQLF